MERMLKVSLGLIKTTETEYRALQWVCERIHGKTPDTILSGQMSQEAVDEASNLTSDQLLDIWKEAKGQGPA